MGWLTDDIAGNLLGNARPKSYAACRQDDFWNGAFMRWWQEGANGKPMYQAVSSCYDDLTNWYAGNSTIEELHYNWVEAPSDPALIDSSARNALRQAVAQGQDPSAAIDQLWYSVEAQMEQVYVVFYEDAGAAKEAIRRKGVEDALEECFPSL
jgi:hypothetical protein